MKHLFGSHDHGPLVAEQITHEERSSYEFKRGYQAAMRDVEKAQRHGGIQAVIALVQRNLPNGYWL